MGCCMSKEDIGCIVHSYEDIDRFAKEKVKKFQNEFQLNNDVIFIDILLDEKMATNVTFHYIISLFTKTFKEISSTPFLLTARTSNYCSLSTNQLILTYMPVHIPIVNTTL